MNDARYVPRDFTLEPRGFGNVETIAWRTDGSAGEAKQLLASQFQHHYVYRIRARMVQQRVSGKAYAAKVGSSYDRIMKVFRGETILRLEDIAAADVFLGEISEFARAQAQQELDNEQRIADEARDKEKEAARQRGIQRKNAEEAARTFRAPIRS